MVHRAGTAAPDLGAFIGPDEVADSFGYVHTLNGTLAFSSATYSVARGSIAVLTVLRSGGNAGKASAHYATANGTATAGSDYTAASGDLEWADGNGEPLTLSVQTAASAGIGETFTVTLSAATGAALGAPATATVTITA